MVCPAGWSAAESREQLAPKRRKRLPSNLLARQHWHDHHNHLVDDEQREIAKLKPLLAEADRQLDGLIVVLNKQTWPPWRLFSASGTGTHPQRHAKPCWIDWRCN